jgi:hypothetical protein
MSDTQAQLTEQLALVGRQLEEHRTAIWLLEQRQLTLRLQLRESEQPAPVQVPE